MKCHDCELEADSAFTMDFTDVEPGAYLYWCTTHGQEAHKLNEALQDAFKERPGFATQLEAEIDKVTQ